MAYTHYCHTINGSNIRLITEAMCPLFIERTPKASYGINSFP